MSGPDRNRQNTGRQQDVKRSPARNFVPDGGERRTQHGALCWRRVDGAVQVLLITSRDTGRWVIPKGWPVAGLDAAASAAREAWEEAGARGDADPAPLGWYGYDKLRSRRGKRVAVPCVVSVHALQVAGQDEDFPEAQERRRQWFAPSDAAALVDEPELAALIAGFRPPGDGADGA